MVIKDFTGPNIKKDYLFYNGQNIEADIAYAEIYSYAMKTIHIIICLSGALLLLMAFFKTP